MTVGELIEKLSQYDKSYEVLRIDNSGGYEKIWDIDISAVQEGQGKPWMNVVGIE